MPHSAHFRERTAAAGGEEPLYLLEITHAQLSEPIRVVRDTEDLVSNGELFQKCWFEVVWPEDVENRSPRAPLRVDNVGKELTEWLDASAGGRGAQVQVMLVMRDTPDVIEDEALCDLLRVRQDGAFVLGEIGYEDVMNLPGLGVTHRPDVSPGLF